jgi:mono/diheme cytochrome c family protein
LGADTLTERSAQIQAWSPSPSEGNGAVNAALGRRLFGQLCVQCHGAEGRGDGPLVTRLSVRPPDWTLDGWRRVEATDEARSLARIIKFGLWGSPMAGHETLADDEVVALAGQVLRLRGERKIP